MGEGKGEREVHTAEPARIAFSANPANLFAQTDTVAPSPQCELRAKQTTHARDVTMMKGADRHVPKSPQAVKSATAAATVPSLRRKAGSAGGAVREEL